MRPITQYCYEDGRGARAQALYKVLQVRYLRDDGDPHAKQPRVEVTGHNLATQENEELLLRGACEPGASLCWKAGDKCAKYPNLPRSVPVPEVCPRVTLAALVDAQSLGFRRGDRCALHCRIQSLHEQERRVLVADHSLAADLRYSVQYDDMSHPSKASGGSQIGFVPAT
jgi:hypothetical protein